MKNDNLLKEILKAKSVYELDVPTSQLLSILNNEIEEFAKTKIDDKEKIRSFLYKKHHQINQVEYTLMELQKDSIDTYNDEAILKKILDHSSFIKSKLKNLYDERLAH